ncbi:MAG: hypothetical protein IPK82_39810 [Polyangiaceae bacterium]|nr:hypothetical protein [Polyangiaceae bacterium]
MKSSRRRWIQTVGLMGGVSALGLGPFVRALAQGKAESDTFIFIHASGGWDVTLWADPRNEKRGIVDPATTENVDTGGLLHWKDAPFSGSAKTFEPVVLPNVSFPLGPAIGKLASLADRLTLVNGIAMNTVSHPDGTVFSATGQPPSGGRVQASSIDTVLASELDLNVLFPVLSVDFQAI